MTTKQRHEASDHTIIGAPFEPPRELESMLSDGRPADDGADEGPSVRLFKIRAASNEGRRASASILINRRYAWRGYDSGPAPLEPRIGRITLVASDGDSTIGTMSVGFDGPDGLFVEDVFPEEVAALRRSGRRVCEFTKLAMDDGLKSRRVLASLFHVAYIYAYRVMGYDSLLIEVNPRHVRYYEKILGFKAASGEARTNDRVNAPAVLLCLDFTHTEQQIARFGGRPQLSVAERSLYPYSFSIEEEAGIVARLRSPTGELALRPPQVH